MFCSKCGMEIRENENFCFNCGQDLSGYQQELLSNDVLENEIKTVEYKEINQDPEIDEIEDSDAKIQTLINVIGELQDENSKLKKELERYTSEKPTYRRSKFGKKMPKPEKNDIFTKFKKWYNE